MTSDINATFGSPNASCFRHDFCVGEQTLRSPHIRSPIYFVAAAAMVIAGAVGNTLVLVCFCLEIKLRTVSYSLLGHLAMVDLLNCVINIPVYLVMVSTRNSIGSCWFWMMTTPFLTTMSVFIQGLIGISRFFLVTKDAVEFQRYFGRLRSSIYVTLGWVLTAVFIGLVITLMKPQGHDGLYSCSSYSDLNATRQLGVAMILGISGMYFAVAVVFYIRLALFVHNNAMRTTSVKRSDLSTSKILLFLGVISMLSLVFPPLVLVIARSLNVDIKLSFVLTDIGTLVYSVSYCINPIFFFTKIPLFRATLQRMFRKRTRIAPIP